MRSGETEGERLCFGKVNRQCFLAPPFFLTKKIYVVFRRLFYVSTRQILCEQSHLVEPYLFFNNSSIRNSRYWSLVARLQ